MGRGISGRVLRLRPVRLTKARDFASRICRKDYSALRGVTHYSSVLVAFALSRRYQRLFAARLVTRACDYGSFRYLPTMHALLRFTLRDAGEKLGKPAVYLNLEKLGNNQLTHVQPYYRRTSTLGHISHSHDDCFLDKT